MSTELETVANTAPIRTGAAIKALIPEDFDGIWRMALAIEAAGWAPKGMEKAEKISIAIIQGFEIGLPPMQAIQSIAVINGRPTLWGDAALALVRASGMMDDFEETITGNGDERTATCYSVRKGQKKPVVTTFSVAQAKQAKLWNKAGPWQEYSDRMLQMRARAFNLRDGYTDVLRGFRIREEEQDLVEVTASDAPPPIEGEVAQTTQQVAPKQTRAPRQQAKAAETEKPVDTPARTDDPPPVEEEAKTGPEAKPATSSQDTVEFSFDHYLGSVLAYAKQFGTAQEIVDNWKDRPKPARELTASEKDAVKRQAELHRDSLLQKEDLKRKAEEARAKENTFKPGIFVIEAKAAFGRAASVDEIDAWYEQNVLDKREEGLLSAENMQEIEGYMETYKQRLAPASTAASGLDMDDDMPPPMDDATPSIGDKNAGMVIPEDLMTATDEQLIEAGRRDRRAGKLFSQCPLKGADLLVKGNKWRLGWNEEDAKSVE